ncbi:hypothetical protein [Mangrovimonas sp. TPBH4]|uniref:hypothetical protein n=1 Tax=Mangrovimonas sp. TPBH4 TaxID=1645914 RepID=UPI0006B595BD|nr:hypothetical protein [Mangrovimonas sp. TPBH4]
MSYKKVFVYLGLCSLLFYAILHAFFGKHVKFYLIEHELQKINQDSLGKYYQLFYLTRTDYSFDEEDFNSFLAGKNDVLREQLIKADIKLNSGVESKALKVFKGFYHIGPDGIDDNASYVPLKGGDILWNKDGDLLLSPNDYYDFQFDEMYGIDDNYSLFKLGRLNPNVILGNSLECKGRARIKLDTTEYEPGRITSKDGVFDLVNIKGDKKTLDILLKDSKILEASKKYKHIYVEFRYKPIENFFCD